MRSTVLKTCGRRRTWQIVQMPSRASATAMPFALPRHPLEDARARCWSSAATSAARSAAIRSSDGLQLAVLRGQRLAVGVDGFLLRGELRLGALDRRREVVGLDHLLEHLVLERLDLASARSSISCWIAWYS